MRRPGLWPIDSNQPSRHRPDPLFQRFRSQAQPETLLVPNLSLAALAAPIALISLVRAVLLSHAAFSDIDHLVRFDAR